MIPSHLLTITDVAEYLQMPETFVEHEIRMEYLQALYIGYDWRIKPSALVDYIEAKRTLTPIVSRGRMRAVDDIAP